MVDVDSFELEAVAAEELEESELHPLMVKTVKAKAAESDIAIMDLSFIGFPSKY